MPPKQRLTESEVKSIELWIANGAPDPRNSDSQDSGPKPVGMSIDDGRAFWSFRLAVKPEPPKVQNQNWLKSPIDAFVLAKLEESDSSAIAKSFIK